MVNVFIIHGSYGNPAENWFPWLKEELEKLGCNVFVPKFPTPEKQDLENWMDIFEEYEKELDENSIVVGHSLGPAFLLSLLEKHKVRAAFFVSGFLNLLGNPDFDNINKSFIEKEFDWERIKENCKRFYVIHSDNDPYVPMKEAENLAKKIGTNVIVVKGAGHFNESAGYKKFDFLLDMVKKELL